MTLGKEELRQKALQIRRALGSAELSTLSRKVARNLGRLPEFGEATKVASYVAKDDEVQTAPIIESLLTRGARVFVPKTDPGSGGLLFFEVRSLDELTPGHFGVLEPSRSSGARAVPLRETDLALVPLVAWDVSGSRIGYGKGYFDSALRSRGSSLAVGLALEVQRVDRIPVTDRDAPLDVVVTENRIVRFGPSRPTGARTEASS